MAIDNNRDPLKLCQRVERLQDGVEMKQYCFWCPFGVNFDADSGLEASQITWLNYTKKKKKLTINLIAISHC